MDCRQRGQLDFDRFRNNRKWHWEPEIRRCGKRRRSEERLTRRCRSAERREPGQWRTDTRLYLLAYGERGDASGKRRPRQRHTQHGGDVRLDRRQQCTLDHADIHPRRKRHRDHQFQRSRQLGRRTERHADDRRTDLYRDSVGSVSGTARAYPVCLCDQSDEPIDRLRRRRRDTDRADGGSRLRLDGREQRTLDYPDIRRQRKR